MTLRIPNIRPRFIGRGVNSSNNNSLRFASRITWQSLLHILSRVDGGERLLGFAFGYAVALFVFRQKLKTNNGDPNGI